VRALAAPSIVREVAAEVGLAEGERGVRSVLAALVRLEPVSTRGLSRTVDLPVPIVASICGELRKREIVSSERPAQLTELGRELFGGGKLALRRSARCSRCSGHGVAARSDTAAVLGELNRIAREAPEPRLDLDQCHCTAETKLRRILAIHDADALVGRRVLLLGDDDLMSLTLAAFVERFGSSESVAELAILDVDAEVVEHVRRRLARSHLSVTCLRHDLRRPLPDALRRSFDTVVTDPPYTVAGATLFLSRAAEALDGRGDVFLSFGSRRPDASFHLQRAIGAMGFAIVRLWRDFNEYVGAGALGGTSSLYHVAASAELSPLVTGHYDGPLYTADG
jgi:N4-bis(aminopropyl)spermidine synthase